MRRAQRRYFIRLFYPPNARGHRHLNRFTFGGDRATRGVDLEHDDVVAGHVGAEKPEAVGGDEEILRAFAATGLDGEERERAIVGDAVADEAVVAAIRAVEVLAIGRDLQVGGVALAGEIFGQRGDGLFLFQRAIGGAPVEDGDGVGEFVDEIDELAIRMEGQVTRAAARRELGEGLRGVRREFRAGGVERVDHDLVDAEVAGEGVFAIGADDEAVGVRSFLSLRINAAAAVLEKRHRLAERAVALYRQRGDVASDVVRNEHRFAGGIDIQEAGGRTASRLMIQALHLAGPTFKHEGDDVFIFITAKLFCVDGIEELLVRRHRDEERVSHIHRAMLRLQCAFFQIESEGMNAAAFFI